MFDGIRRAHRGPVFCCQHKYFFECEPGFISIYKQALVYIYVCVCVLWYLACLEDSVLSSFLRLGKVYRPLSPPTRPPAVFNHVVLFIL